MNYRIERHNKEIIVYCKNELVLKVNKREPLGGRLTLQFYRDSALILEATYLVFLFRKYINIEVQNLELEIELKRNKGDYVFIYNDKQLEVKKRFFKNPICHLLIDDKIVGGISIKLWGVVETPTIYNVEFYEESDYNIYIIMLFIVSRTTDLIVS